MGVELRLPQREKAEVKTPGKKKVRAWNTDVTVGRKKPLTRKEVKRLHTMLQSGDRLRELAMFDLAIDSMLRASDLLRMKVSDVRDSRGRIKSEFGVKQGKTGEPVECRLTDTTRKVLARWIKGRSLSSNDFLFPGRRPGTRLCRRRYQEIVKQWVKMLGLPHELYGTHSLRRTKASMLYEQTLDAAKVQYVLGQCTLSAAQAYLGVDKKEALDLVQQIKLF